MRIHFIIGVLLSTSLATPARAQTARDTTFIRVDDMLVPQAAPRSGALAGPASVTAASFTPWPGGLVPIEFTAGTTDANRDAVFAACAIWSKRAAVSCVPRTNQSPFLRVTSESGGCYATLGSYAGPEPARLNLDVNCWGQKSILHEFGHVFGLQHEHQRADRDAYISIDFSAVDPSYQYAFAPITDAPTRGAYDFLSVMHYHDFAFAARPLTRTMLPKPGFEWYTYSLGSSDFPSPGDGDAVRAIYGGGALYWPARVQNLRIAPGTSGIRLGWDPPVGAPDVTEYSVTVYRGASYLESGIFQTVPVAPAAGGVVLNLQPGHYFAIVKGDSADGEYARSTVLPFSVTGATTANADQAPGVPTLSASAAGSDRVTLSWQRGAGAVPTLYTIYAGTTSGSNNLGSFPMGTAQSVTTTAPAGVTAYIRVVASNEVGGSTSNEVSFYVPGTPSSSTPSLTVEADQNPVSLAWSAPAGSGVTQYTLVAGTAPGGANLGTFPMGQARSLVANAPVGIPLYVRVLATTRSGIVASNEVQFQLPPPWVATPPTLAPATVSGTTVGLSWSGSNASAYTILARAHAGGPVIASVPVRRAQAMTIPNVPRGTYLVTIAATPGFAESNTVVVIVR